MNIRSKPSDYQLKLAFKKYDQTKSGTLDAVEALDACISLKLPISLEEILDKVKLLNKKTGGSGRITLKQFVKIVRSPYYTN